MFCISGIINENFPTFFLKHKREKCFFAKVPEMEYKREKVPNFYLFPNSPKCPQSQPKINWQLVDLQFIPTRQTMKQGPVVSARGWCVFSLFPPSPTKQPLSPRANIAIAIFFKNAYNSLHIHLQPSRSIKSSNANNAITQISALQPYCRQAQNINARLNR